MRFGAYHLRAGGMEIGGGWREHGHRLGRGLGDRASLYMMEGYEISILGVNYLNSR